MKLSELELKMMAKEAADKFINEQVPLNTSITKMARDKSMNPHQIARVCEMANVDSYHTMWDKVGSGEFSFDLADQEKIAGEMDKTASFIPSEYTVAPSKIASMLTSSIDVESPEMSEKTAADKAFADSMKSEQTVSMKKVLTLMNKLSHYIGELDSAAFESEIAVKEAETKVKDMLKVAALRGENIMRAYSAAVLAFPGKTEQVRDIFTKIASDLQSSGIINITKLAKEITEDATGSSTADLNKDMGVVNKKHPILKHIDTIIMSRDDLVPRVTKAREYLVKKVEVLKSTLKNKKFDNEK